MTLARVGLDSEERTRRAGATELQALFRWAAVVCKWPGGDNVFQQWDAAADRRVERFFYKAHARSLAERPTDVRRSSSVAAWEACWRRLCHAYSLMHGRDAVLALTEAEDELLLRRMEDRATLNLWIDCGLTVRAEICRSGILVEPFRRLSSRLNGCSACWRANGASSKSSESPNPL